MALALSAPEEAFAETVRFIADRVWPPEGSLLGEFLESAQKDPRRDHLRRVLGKKEAGGLLFERLLLAPALEDPKRKEVLEKALARLREAYYTERLEEVKALLKERATTELLKEYQELRAAIEAERRLYRGP
jgi:DNA primase